MARKISVVMIVKNEAEVLARCLDSVKEADEIIIVDTGSEDNTVEIAKKYTNKVFEDYKWNDSFCEARNHAKAKATGDWILSIDADEFCHSFFEVREAVKIADSFEHLAVNVKLMAEDNGQLHLFPRLFKRDERVWWVGAIHNHLSVLGNDDGDVRITYGYSPAHFKDPNRAMRILEKEVKNPENIREMFYLGREYWYRFRYEDSVRILGQYVQRSRYLAEKAEAFLIMSMCYWRLKMGEDARDACLQAIKINPHFKEAILFMSEIVWPQHAEQWKKMAETANNADVLFIRT